MFANDQMTASFNLSAIDEQLFTDVSPEQAAIVEGGLQQVTLTFLRCVKAGADRDGTDEVFATFNGVRAGLSNGSDLTFSNPKSMRANATANIATTGRSSNGGSIRVALFDKDSTKNDLLGGFTVSSATRNGTRTIKENGSEYQVGFSAF
jgi:hypothetical protein